MLRGGLTLWIVRNVRSHSAGVFDDAPVLDLDDPLRMRSDRGIVRNENDGAALRMQCREQREHLFAAAAVERASRLVRENDFSAVHQCTRNRHALLLSARELIGPVAGTIADPE